MYQDNKLVVPNALTLAGVPIDLRKVKTPAFLLSTKEDHIAPWKSTYASTQIYQGPIKFVLSASGHIAGVINPPGKSKYGHWENTKLPKSPDDWFTGAKYADGSWWPIWEKWIGKYIGDEVDARQPGDGTLTIIEDAPGSYVLTKAG
jgi:polyhydroxyalkanoate synthase